MIHKFKLTAITAHRLRREFKKASGELKDELSLPWDRVPDIEDLKLNIYMMEGLSEYMAVLRRQPELEAELTEYQINYLKGKFYYIYKILAGIE
jgi:hypothetical protein